MNDVRPPLSADTHATGSEKLRGHLAMALFALLIAGSFSIGKRATPFIESGALNAIRFLIAVILMGFAAHFFTPASLRVSLMKPTAIWRFFILGALMGFYFVTMFVALKVTSPVSTGAVFTLMPLMSAGFGFLFMRQISGPIVIVSLLVAAAGAVWVIFRGDAAAMMAFDVGRGEIIYFFGVAAHGAYAPLVKKFSRGEPLLAFTFWTLAATGICIVVYAVPEIIATDWLALPSIVWIAIAYLAVFTTAGTFFLLQYAALRIPAGKAIAYGYLTPVYIIFLEGLTGAGWVSPAVLVGALVIVLGLVILVLAPDV